MSDKTKKQQAEDAMFVVLDWQEEGDEGAGRFQTVVVGAEATDDNPLKVVGVYATAEEAEGIRKALEAGAPKREKAEKAEDAGDKPKKDKGKAKGDKGARKGKGKKGAAA